MADIFVSYAKADRQRVETLVRDLEAAGYSVWWDRQIDGGAEFARDIERELAAASAVIVVWTENSAASRWVKDEAELAAEAGSQVFISLDGTLPPIGLKQFNSIDFTADEKAAHDSLLRSLAAKIDAPSSSDVTAETVSPNKATEDKKPVAIIAAAGIALFVAGFIGLSALRGDGQGDATQTVAAETVVDDKSIAVLPFVALSNDDSDEYFGKGVAEELLNALAQFPDLKVAARTSAFSFEGQNVDLRDVGQQLGVAHVLEGSVRRSGNRLRITAQLIRVEDGFHLWSETYERELTDIFEIQDDIVDELIRNMQLRLGVGGRAGEANVKSVDPRAYEHYLRGLYLWGSRDKVRGNRNDALASLLLAVEFDPKFADAWGAIGVLGAFSDPNTLRETPEEFVARTEAAFERALALDPDNITAHIGLTPWHSINNIDLEKSRYHLDRALTLAPNRAESHYAEALYWGAVGDDDKSARAYERAIALDPLNNAIQRVHAQMLAFTGRFDLAFEYLERCEASRCMSPVLFIGAKFFTAFLARDEARAYLAIDEYDALSYGEHNLRDIADVFFDKNPDPAPILNANLGQSDHPSFFGIIAPVIAETAGADVLIERMEQLQEDRLLLAEPFAWAPFTGANDLPESVLRHPRYHALWARDGLAELAEARRTNGQTAGLPLPIEGTE